MTVSATLGVVLPSHSQIVHQLSTEIHRIVNAIMILVKTFAEVLKIVVVLKTGGTVIIASANATSSVKKAPTLTKNANVCRTAHLIWMPASQESFLTATVNANHARH